MIAANRFMTANGPPLRAHPARHTKARPLRILCTILVAMVSTDFAYANTVSWQSLQSIENAALEHVNRTQSGSGGRVESRIKALDRRLKLAQCGTKLETFTPSTASGGATQIIGVRCHSPKPWKVYVPISSAVFKAVIVSNRPLVKGDTVSTNDVRLEERDVTRIPNRYLTDLSQLEGRVLRRDVRDQTIISRNVLDAEDVVKRGQNVTLMVRNKKLNVRMRGEALNTAALNERIRVKNLASQRIVEGIVVSRQEVLVDH